MPSGPSPISINLLQKRDISASPFGRIAVWAVTYGRYIMIGTEIVVLLAFIARFSLDRKLTDLKEEMSQKQAILVANSDFEQEIKSIQERVNKVKSITQNQDKPERLVSFVASILPPDVFLKSLDYSSDKLILDATAGSSEGFSQFLIAMTSNKDIRDVEVGDVQKQPGRGISFKISASLVAPKK